jgi:hypothetical protein
MPLGTEIRTEIQAKEGKFLGPCRLEFPHAAFSRKSTWMAS